MEIHRIAGPKDALIESDDTWNAFGKDYYANRPMPSYTKLVLSAAARFEDDNARQTAAP